MLYLAGGSRDGQLSNEVFEAHLRDRTVFPLPALRQPRAGFFMFTDKKFVYCLGGTAPGAPAGFERYCPEKREWAELAPLEPGFEASYCVNDRHFVCVFSAREPQRFFKYPPLSRYLIADNRWIQETDPLLCSQLPLHSNACLASGLKHLLLGRAVRDSSELELLHFDPLTNKAKKLSQLALPEAFLPCVMAPLKRL